jgi:hypothetical protein
MWLPILLWGCADPVPEPPAGSATLTVLHSSRLEGELEPCG